MKTKCAECAGSCGLAKKYKETMAVAGLPLHTLPRLMNVSHLYSPALDCPMPKQLQCGSVNGPVAYGV